MCYRCGAGTTDPVRKPVPIKRGGSAAPLLSGIAILIVALIMLAFAKASGFPKAMDAAAVVLALVGAAVLGARLLRRR